MHASKYSFLFIALIILQIGVLFRVFQFYPKLENPEFYPLGSYFNDMHEKFIIDISFHLKKKKNLQIALLLLEI